MSSRTSLRLLALTVAMLSIALRWLGLSFSGKTIEEVDIFLSLGMLSIFALLMIQSFLVTGRAWAHHIAAAIAVYLLLGLIWARLYEFVELLAEGAFRVPAGEHLNSANLVYFSFVRLSTLGVRGLRAYSCRSAQFGGPRGDYGSTAYGDPDFPAGLRKVGKSGGKATQVRTDA